MTCTSTSIWKTTCCFRASAERWHARPERRALLTCRRRAALGSNRLAAASGTRLRRCRPFAVEHVGDRQHGMPPHHAWARVAHHHAGRLALPRPVAVNLAVRAGWLVRAVGAARQSLARVVEEAGAFLAQVLVVARPACMMIAAIDAQHHADRLQFARESARRKSRLASLGSGRPRFSVCRRHGAMLRAVRSARRELSQM